MSSEICQFYLRGACKFGPRCWNSHDRRSIRVPRGDVSSVADRNETTVQTPSSSAFQQNKKTQFNKVNGLQTNQTNDSRNKIQKSPKNIATLEKEKPIKVKVNIKQTVEKSIKQDYENMKSLIDSHLQCTICYELFVKPVVLNCSHTFCDKCVSTWMLRVKRCPICRKSISSKLHCLVLNTFIEKIVEVMPEDFKQQRDLAIGQNNNNLVEESINVHLPDSYFHNLVEDIQSDIFLQESEMYRMNLHDTVVSTGGVNPLRRYRENSLDSYFRSFDIHVRNSFI